MNAHAALRRHADADNAIRFGAMLQSTPSAVMAIRGWVCDRYTDGGMIGSRLLARRAADILDAPLTEIGEREGGNNIGWAESLDKARPFLTRVNAVLDAILSSGQRPMVFANRCGASIATIATVLRHHPDATLVWIDAHGDFNTPESTPTGYLGGMVLTALCGLWDSGFGAGLSPDRIVLVGARDLDDAEKALIDRHGVKTIVTRDRRIDPRLVSDAVGGRPVWLHVDTDVVDPAYLPAEYIVPGGLSPDGLRDILAAITATAPLIGYEMTEFEAPTDPAARQAAVDTIMHVIEPVLDAFLRKAV